MGAVNIVCLVENIVVFCLLFWLLTWAGEYFYTNKQQKTKNNFYECGFKSTIDINIQTNFNFILYCIFLILYDIEFLFLIPFYMNFLTCNIVHLSVLYFFFTFIIGSLVYDYYLNALNWKL